MKNTNDQTAPDGLVEAVSQAMQTAWDNICSDTGCHPVDIQHGRGKHLTFEPNHWVRAIAMHLSALTARDNTALREAIIAARNFLAIGETEHADRHLKAAIQALAGDA